MTCNVLLVDDDDDDYQVVRDLISDLDDDDIELIREASYDAGLQALVNANIQVCLVDFRIGSESGVEFIRKLKAIGCTIPMILLTGAGDDAIDLAAQTAGASNYLDKEGLTASSLERALRYATNQLSSPDHLCLSAMGPATSDKSLISSAHAIDAPRILLIEDDEDDYLLTKDLLLDVFGKHLKLDWISSWRQAQEIILQSIHDVIIVDYRLGERNGLELVREAVQLGCSVPFIVLTGEGNREIDLEAMRAGATDYLIKGEITGPLLDRSVRYAVERHRAERRLAELAQIDQLTGLANRYRFREFLDHATARADRHGHRVALMLIDLNRFKAVNDTYGHAAGDLLLQEIADRLRGNVRTGDLVARLGGDEFTIVMTDIVDLAILDSTAKRLLSEIGKAVNIGNCDVEVGGSIGVALYPDDASSSDALIVSADTAMYAGKEDRIGACHFYTAEMHRRATRRLELEKRLRHAVEAGQLELYYQPQVELSSGRLLGFEALLRWHHPKLGLVSPTEFIQLAEESSLILDIGNWVLESSCAQLAAWRGAGFPDMHVAINFSARQFRDSGLVDTVADALNRYRLPPHFLEIEITESDILQKPKEAYALLNAFSDFGVCVALDDFGTGYSSLNHLRSFPGSVIKIDQSFIHDIDTIGNDRAIVKSLISMAHNLNLRVVAEGVERHRQLDYLRETGCDVVQGYLISRPCPALAIDKAFFDKIARKVFTSEVALTG